MKHPHPPVFAGDEAHLLGLVGGGDPAGLPPLLVPTVDDVQDVPEVEAQRLAEEAAVCRLVVVKQSPGGGRRAAGTGGFTNRALEEDGEQQVQVGSQGRVRYFKL